MVRTLGIVAHRSIGIVAQVWKRWYLLFRITRLWDKLTKSDGVWKWTKTGFHYCTLSGYFPPKSAPPRVATKHQDTDLVRYIFDFSCATMLAWLKETINKRNHYHHIGLSPLSSYPAESSHSHLRDFMMIIIMFLWFSPKLSDGNPFLALLSSILIQYCIQ